MTQKLTIRQAPRTDDGPCLGPGPVWRWIVDGLPDSEWADIAEFEGRWRILQVRDGMLEQDARDFATAEAAFTVLVEEHDLSRNSRP
jgi:hypothetical protein